MPRTLQKGRFLGLSRIQQQIKSTLGIISADQMNQAKKFRDPDLDILDAYYENRQYSNLPKWDEAIEQEDYVPVRKRQPRIKYNLAKVLVDKVAAKLVGNAVFPTFVIEDDTDDTEFFRFVQKAANFKLNMLEPVRHMLLSGSSFVRFQLIDGQLIMEHANSKYCYPVFDAKGELSEIEIKYVFDDVDDKDGKGDPKKKWYRLLLSQTSDILFDNPEYQEGVSPTFAVVEQVDHNLGWVQGEWLRTSKHKFSPDGYSIIGDILDFIDELNYSLSQSSQAVGYNQEPQLGVKGMDEDEIDSLIRSSQKAWNLGREGEAAFIESDLQGVDMADKVRGSMRNNMLDVVRVVLHDPEQIQGNAQSGKAMEILHAPLVELVDELRLILEPSMRNLLIKMGMTLLELNSRGEETALEIPKGYMPSSLDLVANWPPIFPLTLDDITKKVAAAVQVSTANIISRETCTRWLAQYFGVEDIEEELSKIASQPQLNPFGSFGGQ